MIIFLFYLMETFQYLSSLHRYVIFLLLATISKGLACEGPSSPLCFRQDEDKDVYICEWDFSTNENNVKFDLYYNNTIDNNVEKIGSFKETRIELIEETLIVGSEVDIWVEARAGNSFCTSPLRSGILSHTVKYETPQNIAVSWMRNNLSLSWQYDHPSLAEVLFRKYEHQTESWEKRQMNTTTEASTQKLIIMNLLRNTAYQVQIRHRSIKAENPLWSNWSPVLIVPAELEQPPVVTIQTKLLNGTRQVMLTWKPMPHAAAVGGVIYSVSVTQWSLKCPCKRTKSHNITANSYSFSVSYSAVNITVTARNAAGLSPPAVVHIPAAVVADLKSCDKTLLDKKLKKTCLEFYEVKDANLIPERVWCLTARNRTKERKRIKNEMNNHTRYLYFEHKCHDGKPQTVKMCFYYKEEDVPDKMPENFVVNSTTHNSADLSWKEMSYKNLRGVLTHYKLCTLQIHSQNKPKVCFNISASTTKHRLENLKPRTKYNVSLAAVTQKGEGPSANQSFTTDLKKPFNAEGISFGLLIGFFLFSIVCTAILKRIRNKLFPPVPKPVIPDISPFQPKSKELCERTEEVHELTLHQIVPDNKSASEELTSLKGEWDDGTEPEEEEDECCSGECDDERSSVASRDKTVRKSELKDLEQVETELAMLIYRNGLVFDVKSESL